MKLIELPNSPFWGVNIHVGYHADGKRRYSPRSTKVRRDPSRVDDKGRRLDKLEAEKIATALQQIAYEAMEENGDEIARERAQEWVESLLRVMGKKIKSSAPSWNSFATETLTRHCRDLSPKTVRSYWSKKSTFDKWLEKHPRLSVNSSLADFKLSDIQSYYDDWMEAGGQSTTANGNLTGIQLVFEEAVIHDHIAKNPCKGVKRRDNVMIPKSPFTLAELAAITSALAKHSESIEFAAEWSLAIRFSMFTGAREGDSVSLRWSDFSEDCREVRFVPQKKANLHRLQKVDASLLLRLPEFVANGLMVARNLSTSEFMTPGLRAIGNKAGRSGLGPRFREIMDFAGIKYSIRPAKGSGGKAQCSHGYHSFRHTTKSFLEAGGVSRETNNLVTGHCDPKVAARYIHADKDAIFRECEPVFEIFREAIGG